MEKFTQARDVTFLNGPILSKFGTLGVSYSAKKVTVGIYVPTEELNDPKNKIIITLKVS